MKIKTAILKIALDAAGAYSYASTSSKGLARSVVDSRDTGGGFSYSGGHYSEEECPVLAWERREKSYTHSSSMTTSESIAKTKTHESGTSFATTSYVTRKKGN
jgi:hypothetical protein